MGHHLPERRPGTLLSVISGLLIVAAVMFAPVALISAWARAELVDTNRFVSTFGPLVQQRPVQELMAQQATAAIDSSIDINGTVNSVFEGIADLGLPAGASSALALLEAPAADGVRSLINQAALQTVASPQFSAVWDTALRQTHQRTVSLLQGNADAAVQLSDDGTIALELGPVIAGVRQSLLDQGFTLAASIPELDRAIPLVSSDALTATRTVYNLAVAVGFWLPILLILLAVVGVWLARNRLRALAWTLTGLTVSLLTLAIGVGVGRRFFVGSVAPDVMPADAANAIFSVLTRFMLGTTVTLTVLALIAAVVAWVWPMGHLQRLFSRVKGGELPS